MNVRNRRKLILTVLCGLLVLILAAAVFLTVNGRMKDRNYTEAMKSAEKYLADNRYEDAVIAYKKAISADPKKEEAYLSLAEVYIEQDEPSKAKAILRKGVEETSSFRLKRMLDSLNGEHLVSFLDGGEKEQPLSVDLKKASGNIAWNTSFLQKILHFDFEAYKDAFGPVKELREDEAGYLEVVHGGLEATCYYRNTEENREIVDVSRRTPSESGMPEKITVSSLDIIFRNFEGGVGIDRLQMLLGEKVTPKRQDERYYIEAAGDGFLLRIETDAEGNVTSSDAWNEIILPDANRKKSSAGRLSGVVTDAVTGDGISRAVLTFIPAKNGNGGETAVSDLAGVFSVDLEPDTYTVRITAEEYIEEEFRFIMREGKQYSGVQFTLSPELTKGTARIVLEWNAEPQDLDSYLNGVTDKGEEVFTSFRHKQGKAGQDVIAELDLDTTNGYGPETTTIYDLNGVYKFQVADYRRTGTMKQYGASVKVYLPGKEPVTITIDPGADVKDIWIVCEIDHGELHIINEAPPADEFTTVNK